MKNPNLCLDRLIIALKIRIKPKIEPNDGKIEEERREVRGENGSGGVQWCS